MSDSIKRDETEVSRRDAIITAGAGGLSMLGFCSACEGADVSPQLGTFTPTKNISKLSGANPIMADLTKGAAAFQAKGIRNLALSRENVIARIQEFKHQGAEIQKLGRDRSVIRSMAAHIEPKEQAKIRSDFATNGFNPAHLKGAQFYFSRSSLLDHTKVVGDLSKLAVTADVPGLNNTNLNTVTGVSYNSNEQKLRLMSVLSDGASYLIEIGNFGVDADEGIKLASASFFDPPSLNLRKKFKPVVVTETVTEPPRTRVNENCFLNCLKLEAGIMAGLVTTFCGACAATLAAQLVPGAQVTLPMVAIACGGCVVVGLGAILICFNACRQD